MIACCKSIHLSRQLNLLCVRQFLLLKFEPKQIFENFIYRELLKSLDTLQRLGVICLSSTSSVALNEESSDMAPSTMFLPLNHSQSSNLDPDSRHAITLSKNLSEAFDQPEFSDLIVRCQTSEFHVHRVIVCAHSNFFKALCTHDTQEKKEAFVDIEDLEPNTVKAVLQCIYNIPYAVPSGVEGYNDPTGNCGFYDDLNCHIRVHAVAIQLSVPAVASYSAERVIQTLDVLHPSVKPDEARSQQAIDLAWSSVPDTSTDFGQINSMKDAVVRVMRRFHDWPTTPLQTEWRLTVRSLLERNPGFAQRFASTHPAPGTPNESFFETRNYIHPELYQEHDFFF